MDFVPDWNSIESTTRWGNGLFWAGIICLILLAVAEMASHILLNRAAALTAKANAGRVLSANQHAAIKTVLTPIYKEYGPLHLWAAQGDREAVRLANSLKPDFEAAGFSVDGVWENDLIGSAGPGILIRYPPTEVSAVARGIASAFQQVGLSPRLVELPKSEGNVEVFVSYRPD
jgi:hypothetical protein